MFVKRLLSTSTMRDVWRPMTLYRPCRVPSPPVLCAFTSRVAYLCLLCCVPSPPVLSAFAPVLSSSLVLRAFASRAFVSRVACLRLPCGVPSPHVLRAFASRVACRLRLPCLTCCVPLPPVPLPPVPSPPMLPVTFPSLHR